MITAPSMNPGRLDRRVSLYSPLDARDAGGGAVTSWVLVATVWAQFLPQTGREIQQAGQKLALALAGFRIRYRQAAATWRVLLGETFYELIAPPVEVGRAEYLDLVCQALDRTDLTIDGVDVQALTVDLDVNDESKAITYATAFSASPSGVYALVIAPAGGYVISATILQASRTTTGCTVNLGAAVPASGYKLSIIAVL